VNYTFSLSSDPTYGPYTTTVNITVGLPVAIRLHQTTAGPITNGSVSFGDGTTVQTFTRLMAGSPVNFTHAYSATGTYIVKASVTPGLSNVNTNVIVMTVIVSPALTYTRNIAQL
jgi:hypothetical protein